MRRGQQNPHRDTRRARSGNPDATPGKPIDPQGGIIINFVVGIVNQTAFDPDHFPARGRCIDGLRSWLHDAAGQNANKQDPEPAANVPTPGEILGIHHHHDDESLPENRPVRDWDVTLPYAPGNYPRQLARINSGDLSVRVDASHADNDEQLRRGDWRVNRESPCARGARRAGHQPRCLPAGDP